MAKQEQDESEYERMCSDYEARRSVWHRRLSEGSGLGLLPLAERERCIQWCEGALLEHFLLQWFERGILNMRWESEEDDEPSFEAMSGGSE